MTKKVKHAQERAASQPEAEREDQSAAGAQQEAKDLVAGDSGQPVEGATDQHTGEPPAADLGSGVGKQGADVLLDGDVPYGDDAGKGSALGTVTLREGDFVGGAFYDGTGLEPEIYGARFVAVLPATGAELGEQVFIHSDKGWALFEWKEPGQWDLVAEIDSFPADGSVSVEDIPALEAAIGAADVSGAANDAHDPDRRLTPFQILYRDDPHFPAAVDAAGRALQVALRILDPDPEKSLSEIAYAHENLNGSSFAEAARYLREVGHSRATVDVVATQLAISGHRESRAVSGAERVALEIFLFTLASLDGFAKAEAARRAREEEEKNRKPAPRTPIDETTMEPVDDPMATW